MYTYNAKVLKVIDGDTLQLNIDLGFRVNFKANCRLNGLNTSELNSRDENERLKAIEAKSFLETLLKNVESVTVYSRSLDKYGRPLVDIYKNEEHINEIMLSSGHAQKYDS